MTWKVFTQFSTKILIMVDNCNIWITNNTLVTTNDVREKNLEIVRFKNNQGNKLWQLSWYWLINFLIKLIDDVYDDRRIS